MSTPAQGKQELGGEGAVIRAWVNYAANFSEVLTGTKPSVLEALADLEARLADMTKAATGLSADVTDLGEWLAEAERALRAALDCKGSYNGVVSELGGHPALCTKCEEQVRAALPPERETR